MAYPTPSTSGSQHGAAARFAQGSGGPLSGGRPGFPPTPSEGDHQLEKLEFALAVALTRGDLQLSENLRNQIAALGGNQEEPGT
jgi:hypothetical protein